MYNATWIPSTPSKDVKLIKVFVRQDNDFSNTSIISVFQKIKGNPDYEQQIRNEKKGVHQINEP